MKKVNYSAIEQYIFDCIDFSDCQKSPTEKHEQISYLIQLIYACKRHNIGYYKNEKSMFIDCLAGLPSFFNIDFENYKIVELCASFGLKTPKNEDIYNFWFGKIYDSIIYLNNKLNKKLRK